MGTANEDAALNRRRHSGRPRGRAAVSDPHAFWIVQIERQNAGVNEWRLAFDELVGRVFASPGLTLFKALEAGVPTYVVNVIARATGEPVKNVMDCRRRSNIDPPCRSNIDPGMDADRMTAGCG